MDDGFPTPTVAALCARAILLMMLAVTGACDNSPVSAADAGLPAQWGLPDRLREISGLALAADGRLFAHNDERGIVYELDYRKARIVGAFALGDPVVLDDFEGIAVARNRLYLVTSAGVVYEVHRDDDGDVRGFDRHPTGIGERCEVEGLDYDAVTDRLLIACKQMHQRGAAPQVFAWSPETLRLDDAATITVDMRALLDTASLEHFHPSALAVRADGSLMLLAARERAVAIVDRNGGVVAAARLRLAHLHPQAEGIAIAMDGTIIIADEGRNGRGRLTVYSPRQGLP